ncbi:MAG TPA: nucleotide exchange factor GrpE [Candidatus Brocadiaceae bacterium]|nr:nucleotide exchange factor GrpE [Candidatus Brocadiaceae bacterium]
MADEAVNAHGDWNALKSDIERNFQQWLGELTEIPQISIPQEMPDIYSFYQELCVFKNELRVGGRRNQEVLSRFGESLSDFQKIIAGLQNKLYQMDKEKAELGAASAKPLYIALANVLERLERLRRRLDSPPKKTFFQNDTNWRNAWNGFKEGFDIAYSYFDSLLTKEGITRIETSGKPFDPSCMAAVAVEYREVYPENQVAEEISPGFLYNGTVIKLAEVKITKIKEKK